ncbi:YlbL family protein [Propionicicella superfundia]|uniref:YlbL family protein n=1 Tax=Propionicicella superfundia TaxID=348582 RepID=UPI0004041EC8|nr:S16 family serine protease [Propionicicella superfundia]
MLTRQTWAAAVSAVIFVAMAAVLAVSSVPFVAWAPGGTYDVLGQRDGKPVIGISGIPTFDAPGQLRVTTVAVTAADRSLSFPEALLADLLPDREVLPRAAVYPAGQSVADIDAANAQAMTSSQQNAIVAALREADIPVTERPMVSVIASGGPAENELEPGDLVVEVDGTEVSTVADVRERVQAHKVGEAVVFSILRDRQSKLVTVSTQASNTSPSGSVVGVGWTTGYSYAADVSINVDSSIGGPSAGLVFAIGIYDLISSERVIDDRSIAGTGEIGTDGTVSGIGGIREKISGAQSAGATMFLVPAANCSDVADVRTSMKLVKVASLKDALAALRLSKTSDADLPSCDG